MGFFNNIKNMIQRSKVKKLNPGKDYNIQIENAYKNMECLTQPKTIPLSEHGDYSMITSIKFNDQMRYRDGTLTNLMIAKVRVGKSGTVENLGEYDNVAFEIPVGYPIDNTILKKISSYHLYQREMPNNKECMYIGRLSNDPNEYNINKDQYTEDYINGPISNKIREENQILQKRIADTKIQKEIYNNQRENEFKEKIHFDTRMAEMRVAEEQKERNKRKDNYYLEPKDTYYLADNKKYESYDGVNLQNGDILKIRNLTKVAKDRNGTYIYTGYVQSTKNEYDPEVLDKEKTPYGIPVVFTTDRKVEDVANFKNPYEIYNLLNLLSQEDNFRNNNGYLNYIGSINNRYGTLDNSERSISPIIRSKISELKQQFYQRKIIEQRNDGQMR